MTNFNVSLTGQERVDDPYYEDRECLVEARKNGQPLISSPVQIIGRVLHEEAFTRHIDFRQLHGIGQGEISPRYTSSFDRDVYFSVDESAATAQYRVHDSLAQFVGVIRAIAQYEHAAYPDADYINNKVGLSIRQQEVPANQAQGNHGVKAIHRDSDPEDWIHMYVVSNVYPTEFFACGPPGFPDDLPELASSHDMTAPDQLGQPFTPQEFEIALGNSTSLHRSPIVPVAVERTFLRAVYKHAV